MACNLMYDDRVSRDREEEFLAVFRQPRPKDEKENKREGRLQWALQKYRDERVNGAVQDFLSDKLNRQNFASRPRAPRTLIRVIDLSGLNKIFSRAGDLIESAFFDDLPLQVKMSRAGAKQLEVERGRWLDQAIGRHGEEAAARAVIDVITSHRKLKEVEGKRHAFFAARWREFGPISKDPDQLAAALGVQSRGCKSRWLMVLRYSVGTAVWLARPTVLDAGFAPCHFPSPAAEPPERGGHPVDLRTGTTPRVLRSEYLHVEANHSIEQWFKAGGLLSKVEEPIGEELERPRRAHHRLARLRYARHHRGWMPRCL